MRQPTTRAALPSVLRRIIPTQSTLPHRRPIPSASLPSANQRLLPHHRCSPSCPLHSSSLPRAFATVTSPNPFPTSSSTHVVSSNLPPSFQPADPEIEGYKTRLMVQRRVYKALTSLPKFTSNPTLAARAPPMSDDSANTPTIGHDDPFAQLMFDELEVDSLDRVEMLVAVEKEFGHEFSDEAFEQFHSVGDLIEAILWSPEAR